MHKLRRTTYKVTFLCQLPKDMDMFKEQGVDILVSSLHSESRLEFVSDTVIEETKTPTWPHISIGVANETKWASYKYGYIAYGRIGEDKPLGEEPYYEPITHFGYFEYVKNEQDVVGLLVDIIKYHIFGE